MRLLLPVLDTDAVKQKNKTTKRYLITPKALTRNNVQYVICVRYRLAHEVFEQGKGEKTALLHTG